MAFYGNIMLDLEQGNLNFYWNAMQRYLRCVNLEIKLSLESPAPDPHSIPFIPEFLGGFMCCLALLRCRMDAILQHSFFDIADTKSLSRLHKKERYWNRDTCDIYYVFYSARNQFLSHAFGGASQR